jgi:hypothetical protein
VSPDFNGTDGLSNGDTRPGRCAQLTAGAVSRSR